MNRLPILALALIPALSAAAQDAFDFHCADVTILQAKAVQKEMGITEAQRTKMNTAAEKHRAVLAVIDRQYKGKQVSPEDMKKINPKLAEAFFMLKKDVCASLTPTQLRRLRELNLQRIGLAALNDDVVAKKIGMTDAQIKSYRATFIAGGQQATKLQQDTAKPILAKYAKLKPKDQAEADALRKKAAAEVDAAEKKIAPQVRAIELATQKKLDGIVTVKQRATFKALMGKPFNPA